MTSRTCHARAQAVLPRIPSAGGNPDRRTVLFGALASGVISPAAATPLWMTVPRRLHLIDARTGGAFNAVYWRDGAYDLETLARINHFMADWRTGEVVQVAVSLLDILWRLQLAARFTVPLTLLSGFRSRQTNAMLREKLGESVAHRSYHVRAMAADVRMPGVPSLALAEYAKRLGLGGVGYYSGLDFVHIDSGPRRAWAR